MNEVQVVCTVLSTDKDQDPDIAAMIGTSAALAISGIPFKGPLGAARWLYGRQLYFEPCLCCSEGLDAQHDGCWHRVGRFNG